MMRVWVKNYKDVSDHLWVWIDDTHFSWASENGGDMSKIQIFDHVETCPTDVSELYGKTGSLIMWNWTEREEFNQYATSKSFIFQDATYIYDVATGEVKKALSIAGLIKDYWPILAVISGPIAGYVLGKLIWKYKK